MWQCVKCAERVEDAFDACWSCGTSRDGVEDPEFRAEEGASDMVEADFDEPLDALVLPPSPLSPPSRPPRPLRPWILLPFFVVIPLSLLSFVARCDNWDEAANVCSLNFAVIGPLWAAAAFLLFARRPRFAVIGSVLAYLVTAISLSLWQAIILAVRLGR